MLYRTNEKDFNELPMIYTTPEEGTEAVEMTEAQRVKDSLSRSAA